MVELVLTALLLVAGFWFGSARERSHYTSLLRREQKLLEILPIRSDEGPLIHEGDTFLVVGNVVIAADFFKNFIGSLKGFFGGTLVSHETLLDRARREAVMRMREDAVRKGAAEVVGVHIDTIFLDGLGAEVAAYGTAIKR